MKSYILLLCSSLLLVGCGVDESKCLEHGYSLVTTNIFGTALSCADLNESSLVIREYTDRGVFVGIGELDEYINVRGVK